MGCILDSITLALRHGAYVWGHVASFDVGTGYGELHRTSHVAVRDYEPLGFYATGPFTPGDTVRCFIVSSNGTCTARDVIRAALPAGTTLPAAGTSLPAGTILH